MATKQLVITGQNWLITPAVALAPAGLEVNRHPIGRPEVDVTTQKWLLVLTGVGTVGVKNDAPGTSGEPTWSPEAVVTMTPDLQAPLTYALSTAGSGISTGIQPANLGFELENWAPYAAVCGVYDTDSDSVDDGFQLDSWQPVAFVPNLRDVNGTPVSQVFQGIEASVRVRNTTVITAMSYNITLLGRIVVLSERPPVVEA